MRRLLPVVLLLVASCSLPTGDTVFYSAAAPELTNASLSPEGIWESTPASNPDMIWLPFPGQVTLEVEHGLGRLPRAWLVYISFSEDGSDSVIASGDLARLVSLDETTVSIRNGTNAQLFARIVLQ